MKRHSGVGLTVLGINEDENVERERKVARELELNYPVLLGVKKLSNKYWAQGIPYTVLIDRKGVVVRRWSGFGKGSIEEMEKAIEETLEQG